MPFLIFLTMLIIQTGLVFHARGVAEAAAQEGAAAARQFDGSEQDADARARRYLDELGPKVLTGHDVVVSRSATEVEVVVTGQVVSLVPFVDLNVEEAAAGPVERYVPPAGSATGTSP